MRDAKPLETQGISEMSIIWRLPRASTILLMKVTPDDELPDRTSPPSFLPGLLLSQGRCCLIWPIGKVGLCVLALGLALASAGVAAWAQQPSEGSANFDRRQGIPEIRGLNIQPNPIQRQALDRLKERLDGALRETFEPTTGVTRTLSNPVGYLSEPRGGEPQDIALEYLNENLDLLGLEPDDVDEFEITDLVTSSTTGASHVYFRQKHQGLPVYNGQLQIHINREGRIISVSNAFMPNLRASLKPLLAVITAIQAVSSAARHLNLPVDIPPRILGEPLGLHRLTPLLADEISKKSIQAELMWLPVGPDLHLVWRFQIHTPDGQHVYDMTVDAEEGLPAEDGRRVFTRFDWVSQDSYNVYSLPAESPNHSNGRDIVVNPADPTTSPLAWHDTGITQYTITRGNNVHAFPGQNSKSEPSCGAQRNCNFPLDLSESPRNYTDASVANLFYWNNLVHDIQYHYGFDERAGNFQTNNFGRGGSGNDEVRAEAQDTSNLNNASFLTPPDGQRPHMRMFIFDKTTPRRDASLDSGIIVHEYGHGITNRQVGGPSNVGCLSNRQQPGEGWSDFFALVYTAKVGDQGTDPRGLGTYVLGQPTDGPGVRTQQYSTDPVINTHTYESIQGMAVPHGVGEVWAQALWEVYWALVEKHGFDPDLSNLAAGAGNHRALLYVNEGLKNTSCSPNFTDARDGIVQAAVDNFDGEDVCRVWDAFADFGLGFDAVGGGPSSTSPTNGFNVPESCWPSPPYPTSGVIDWNVTPTVGYTRQDRSGTVSVQHGGNTLRVTGNRWLRTNQTFTITPSTILEFQFRSASQGEIHGIGFEEDDSTRNDRRIFRIYGTENWNNGINWSQTYTGSEDFETFRIPVGEYYTGSGFRLVIVNDKDRRPYDNRSQFSYVRISGAQQAPFVIVPAVVGQLRNDAENAVEAAGLRVGTVTEEFSTIVPAGDVMRQSPLGGIEVPAGSAVDLVISVGPPPSEVSVPDVVGLTQNNAEAAIVAAGLKVGTVSEEFSTVVFAGDVMRQSPKSGTEVPAGSAIDLVVSLGPASGEVIDWNVTPTVGYSRQDRGGSVTVQEGGATLHLTGNTWRETVRTFTITPSTVLEFEFQSDSQGEIHGIGFDEDDRYLNNPRIFRIYGTENWRNAINWTQVYTGGGTFERFRIPVGEYYTGSGFRLVIVNDKDRRPANSTGRFRNVRIYEK